MWLYPRNNYRVLYLIFFFTIFEAVGLPPSSAILLLDEEIFKFLPLCYGERVIYG